MSIGLRPEAEVDIREARGWYDQQRHGLGTEFLMQLGLLLHRIETKPRQFPKVHGGLRRALVGRFPYAVYFLAERGDVIVLAVLHQRRSPTVVRARSRS